MLVSVLERLVLRVVQILRPNPRIPVLICCCYHCLDWEGGCTWGVREGYQHTIMRSNIHNCNELRASCLRQSLRLDQQRDKLSSSAQWIFPASPPSISISRDGLGWLPTTSTLMFIQWTHSSPPPTWTARTATRERRSACDVEIVADTFVGFSSEKFSTFCQIEMKEITSSLSGSISRKDYKPRSPTKTNNSNIIQDKIQIQLINKKNIW